MMRHSFATLSLIFSMAGWAIFLSLFWDRAGLFIERWFPARAHWVLLLLLLLDLLLTLSALIFGHKSYGQSDDDPVISNTLLTCAGLALAYTFWLWQSHCEPVKRWIVLSLLLALALLGSISAIVLGYMSSGTFIAFTGLLLGYIHLPILVIGILFAMIPWHNA